MNPKSLLEAAGRNSGSSAFDFIIVGSGAGGGPLAARLALAGRRVLLLEAGTDPAKMESPDFPKAGAGEVNKVPGYHAAATEDPAMSWQFSVRHYQDDARQKLDDKYNRLGAPVQPPSSAGGAPVVHFPRHQRFLDGQVQGGAKGGIFYPRTAALGGCTAHHAMIVVAPNDRDWNHIADLTGDNTWRADRMRGYFTKLERCCYLDRYRTWGSRLLGPLVKLWYYVARTIDPKGTLDNGRHGLHGWQPTSIVPPDLVGKLHKDDRQFIHILVGAALSVLESRSTPIVLLKRALVRLRVVRYLDPNDGNTRSTQPEGVFFIPTGVESGAEREGDPQPGVSEPALSLGKNGHRTGVRELLLKVSREKPEHLVIQQGVHVTRVIFGKSGDSAPQAVGVEYVAGEHLYDASPLRESGSAGGPEAAAFFVRNGGEIILCGGAFNTPQLLMLSGIGDVREHQLRGIDLPPLRGADGNAVAPPVALPGVGKNLQDRYEVSVIGSAPDDFPTLEKVSFLPGDPDDPARADWIRDGSGLYSTNGGSMAVLRRSSEAKKAGDRESDLFIFGTPAAFRGYYWGWSRELFCPTLGLSTKWATGSKGPDSPKEQKNLWSWVILKAYTRNENGGVRLRSLNYSEQPEICFDSFNETARAAVGDLTRQLEKFGEENGDQSLSPEAEAIQYDLRARLSLAREAQSKGDSDAAALMDAVEYVRKVNAADARAPITEIQPGAGVQAEDGGLEAWVRSQSWGHHCSCTCRIGSDKWQKDTRNLEDKGAVLDSRFRVHGVTGLRVVDASVFPEIPGYFIVCAVFMISEKAADTILAETVRVEYPAEFEVKEAQAIRRRRVAARRVDTQPANGAGGPLVEDGEKLPERCVGLALSGGGIRSAAFALGVLQGMAKRNLLRQVDVLSSVSGGGFTGGFFGRLFTRKSIITPPPGQAAPTDPCGRVQELLADNSSGPMWWLRKHANYILGGGVDDVRQDLAIAWRNLLSVHLVIGTLLFGFLSLAVHLGEKIPRQNFFPELPLELSRWWWLPFAALVLSVLPATFGYWLAPLVGSNRPHSPFTLGAWVILICGSIIGLLAPGAGTFFGVLLLALIMAWVWQEAARWGTDANIGGDVGMSPDQVKRREGAIVRNRVTRSLGTVLYIFLILLVWVILDSLASGLAKNGPVKTMTGVALALGPFLPLARMLLTRLGKIEAPGGGKNSGRLLMLAGRGTGVLLAVFLFLTLDTLAHRLHNFSPSACFTVTGIALLFSLVLGRAFYFLNLSSLHSAYAARLTRAFQGASNEARVGSSSSNTGQDIRSVHPDDDMPYYTYHPEKNGGPLHFINVCINETVDSASNRAVRERRGVPMCLGPHGVSVSRQYFAEWTKVSDLSARQSLLRRLEGTDAVDAPDALKGLRHIPAPEDPGAFHVFASTKSRTIPVETLSLGSWMAISGAAFGTGLGRKSSRTMAILMGLANVRLGYWWDSGINYHHRPGRYPDSLWRMLARIPITLFRMQSILLSEWRARFHGPNRWFWNLSDGGHLENTGLYELIRRRLPFLILADAGADAPYQWGDIAEVTRQARIDFGAEIRWLDPEEGDRENWGRIDAAAAVLDDPLHAHVGRPVPPPWIQAYIHPEAIGSLQSIGRKSSENGSRQAALARITYPKIQGRDQEISWLLVLKPSLVRNQPVDIQEYAATNPEFPQQPTVDQFFDDAQWESYRLLGEDTAMRTLKTLP